MQTSHQTRPQVVDMLTFTRTVDRFLVHREALGEVFLTDTRRVDDDCYVAAAQLPRSHAYYGDHIVRPALYDPVLLMEACRQAALAGAHAHYDVPFDHSFIMTHFGIRLLHPKRVAVGSQPCELRLELTTKNRRVRDGRVTGYDLDIMLSADGKPIGQVVSGLRFRSRDGYAKLRLSGRGGAELPSSATHPHTPLGTPVDPYLVGRSNPDNVVLVNAEATENGARALLSAPVNHPSMFDHPQDHIPGMVLMEAGRQLAHYAVTEHLGLAPSKIYIKDLHAVFTRFGELEPVTELSVELGERNSSGELVPGLFHARRDPDASDAEKRVPRIGGLAAFQARVEARQNGESICAMDIDVTTLGGVMAHRVAA
jgi:2-oxo-3-(phosphooxy)propyl 3-oxoalkanoate synthase